MFRKKETCEFSKCLAAKTIYTKDKAFIPIQEVNLNILDGDSAIFGTIESQGILMIDGHTVKLFSEDKNIDLELLIKDIPELKETVQKLGGRL